MRQLLPLLALVSLAFAPAPLPRPRTPTDEQKLQGEWDVVRYVTFGREWPKPIGLRAVFAENKMSYLRPDGTVSARWTFDLGRPDGKPMTFDLRGGNPREFILGIYKLESDTLTICNSNRTGDPNRPAEFDARTDGGLMVLKRKPR